MDPVMGVVMDGAMDPVMGVVMDGAMDPVMGFSEALEVMESERCSGGASVLRVSGRADEHVMRSRELVEEGEGKRRRGERSSL